MIFNSIISSKTIFKAINNQYLSLIILRIKKKNRKWRLIHSTKERIPTNMIGYLIMMNKLFQPWKEEVVQRREHSKMNMEMIKPKIKIVNPCLYI